MFVAVGIGTKGPVVVGGIVRPPRHTVVLPSCRHPRVKASTAARPCRRLAMWRLAVEPAVASYPEVGLPACRSRGGVACSRSLRLNLHVRLYPSGAQRSAVETLAILGIGHRKPT